LAKKYSGTVFVNAVMVPTSPQGPKATVFTELDWKNTDKGRKRNTVKGKKGKKEKKARPGTK
jgi:hypothetical protein